MSIQKSLRETFELRQAESINPGDLKLRIASKIKFWLESNPEYFFSICYRLDVPEKKIRHALNTSPPDKLYAILAEIFMEREMKRQQYRMKYSS